MKPGMKRTGTAIDAFCPARVASRAVEPINRTYAPLQAFVDELVRCGLRHAVTCPGSRNAPLRSRSPAGPELEAVSVLDERCAGFFALGMAKATGRPVAVTCTSGTAAANLHPAVIEAWEARVPLIVLTADRLPELREVGAGQSIDQVKLYGSAVNWFVEVGTHEPGRETAIHHRALACRAYWTAAGDRPGPVHLNFPCASRWRRSPSRSTPPTGPAARTAGPGPSCASTPRPPTPTTCRNWRRASPPSRAARSSAAPPPRTWPSPPRGWRPPAAGRCSLSRPRACAAARTTVRTWSPTTTCCCAPRACRRARARPGPARGRHAHIEAARTWAAEAPQVVLDPHAAWHEPTRRAELLLRSAAAPTLDALAAAVEVRAPQPIRRG